MRLASPLFLVLLIPILTWLIFRFTKFKPQSIKFSHGSMFSQLQEKRVKWITKSQPILRFMTLLFMVIALSRPQSIYQEKEIISEGVDIMLALDVSGSMRAEDFKPEHRLNVAKKTISNFISKRESDRIGLVVFSEAAFTQCPLTLDYYMLTNTLKSATFDMAGPGTAVGLAIATSLNRLKNSPSKSKIIVLLTDGVNNSGGLDPLTAAELAKELGIKVYTIGVGKRNNAPVPITDPNTGQKVLVNAELDEVTLKNIAKTTGALYFKATNESTLTDIYNTIDKLEKTDIKTNIYTQYNDHFMTFLILSLVTMIVELFLIGFFVRVAP